MAFLDCKRKFPWNTSYGYPGELRVKALSVIPVVNLTESDIPTLQKQAYQVIKRELLNDPKENTKKAIELWKNQLN